MVLREVSYENLVAKLPVQTLSATIQTPPREIRSRLNLGLLSLYIEASKHVQFTKFGIEFFRASGSPMIKPSMHYVKHFHHLNSQEFQIVKLLKMHGKF
jgi:hypothetical protein